MKTWKILILSLITIVMTSCAQGPGTSNLKVSVAAVTGSANFPGGLFFMGRNQAGGKFLRKVPAADTMEIELPNGIYDFMVVGWDGDDFYKGNNFCSMQKQIALEGGDLPIEMNVSQGQCDNALIKGVEPNGMVNFPPLYITSCTGIQEHIALGGKIPLDLNCDGSTDMFPGGDVSYEVSIIEQTIDGSVSIEALTTCIAGNDLSTYSLPAGNLAEEIFIPVVINAYSEAECAGTQSIYTFKEGLLAAANDSRGVASIDYSTNISKVFLHKNQCNPIQKEKAGFAAEAMYDGSVPYNLICTAGQFESIANAASGSIYELGADIDMSTAHTVPLLNGSLYGQGFSLMDGTEAVFQDIYTIGSDIRISDIGIVNYQVQENGLDDIGVFANFIQNKNTGYKLEITDMYFDENTLLEVYDPGIDVHVGILAGEIDFETANSNDSIEIRNIESYGNITLTNGNNKTTKIGGLIGNFVSVVNLAKIEFSSVGNNVYEPFADYGEVKILGDDKTTKVGGLVGQAKNIEFDTVSSRVEIAGKSYLGGIIGDIIDSDNVLRNIFSEVNFLPQYVATYPSRIGGILGASANYGIDISGAFTRVKIDSDHKVSQVGGFIGSVGATSDRVTIKNSKAIVDFEFDGDIVGGAIGEYSNSSATNDDVESTGFFCDRCLIEGNIGKKGNTDAWNDYRGGFAGVIQGGRFKMSIANLDAIEGNNYIATGFGQGTEASIWESQLAGDIIVTGASASEIVGEVVMANTSIGYSNTSFYKDILSKAQLKVQKSSPNLTTLRVGKMYGHMDNNTSVSYASNYFDNIIAPSKMLNDVESEIALSEYRYCGEKTGGSGLCLSSGSESVILSMSAISVANSGDCGTRSIATPFEDSDDGIDCHLIFEKKWKKYTRDAIKFAGKYSAGNLFQPFPIDDESEWIGLATDAFLMKQTYSLQKDLNFSGGTISSIGSNSGDNIFSGRIIANNHSFNDFTVAGTGLIVATNGATIGWYDDPLIIKNGTIACNANSCGVLGVAQNTNLFIRAYNVDVEGLGYNNIGGFVGIATERVSIKESGFFGSVTGTSVVGGAVGSVTSSNDDFELEESVISLSKLEATTNYLGGFFGNSSSPNTIKIKKSYLVATTYQFL